MPIHVRCEQNVAPIVFLPGDPNRAKWIAENVFEGAICTTSYRQMLGYTGLVGGVPVSIQTTGMGGPSACVVMDKNGIAWDIGNCGRRGCELGGKRWIYAF